MSSTCGFSGCVACLTDAPPPSRQAGRTSGSPAAASAPARRGSWSLSSSAPLCALPGSAPPHAREREETFRRVELPCPEHHRHAVTISCPPAALPERPTFLRACHPCWRADRPCVARSRHVQRSAWSIQARQQARAPFLLGWPRRRRGLVVPLRHTRACGALMCGRGGPELFEQLS